MIQKRYVLLQTDHFIEARRPNMVIIDKIKIECKIIDFVCTFDSRIEEKEKDRCKVITIRKEN